MRYSNLDFGPPNHRASALLLVLLTALTAWGGLLYLQIDREVTALQAQLASLRGHAAPERQTPILPPERLKEINGAIRSLNKPWPELLLAIESVQAKEVQITHLEIRGDEPIVLVTAEAREMDLLVSHMEALAHVRPFYRFQPVRQERRQNSEASGLQVVFAVHWQEMQ